ncbi:hypothetical protein KAX97_13560 [candidate division WOR-3 bacterium]|nr:hypothetical protein [candidate division WOR-3 bacterium]
MINMGRRLLMIALIGLWVAGLVGCGAPKEEESVQAPSQEEVSTEPEEATLPGDFPKDIPVYPDAKLDFVHKIHPDSLTHVEFTTKAGLNEVASYLKQELKKQGWQISEETGSEAMEVIAFSVSKDKRFLVFALRLGERTSSDFKEKWKVTQLKMDYYPLGYF